MPVVIDHRSLPPEEREEILATVPPSMAPPPVKDGEEPPPFELPEPEINWPEGVQKETLELGGVPGICFRWPERRSETALLHIHGGGFTGGTPAPGYRLMHAMLTRFGVDGYSVEYTLAPKAKAPAQLNECLAFYNGLLDLGYRRILLAGESAGGNLVICLGLKLKDIGAVSPGAVAAASPVVDFTGKVVRLGAPDDPLAGPTDSIARMYIGDGRLDDPYVSPLYGGFNGYPPLLLQCGSEEGLKYDSMALAEVVDKTDCDCTFSIWEGAGHAFGIDPGEHYFNRAGMEQIVGFFAEKCGLK